MLLCYSCERMFEGNVLEQRLLTLGQFELGGSQVPIRAVVALCPRCRQQLVNQTIDPISDFLNRSNSGELPAIKN